MYESVHTNSDEYANCTPPDKDNGLDGSVSYTKKRKGGASQDNGYSNGAGVTSRESM